MSKRGKPYLKKSFESSGASSDTSANIYCSMINSAAWLDLTASQKVLYVTCKAQYYAEKKKPIQDDNTTFTKGNGLKSISFIQPIISGAFSVIFQL